MTPAEMLTRLTTAAAAAITARRAALAAGAETIRQQCQDWIGSEAGPGDWSPLANTTLVSKQTKHQLGRQSEQDTLMADGTYKASWTVDPQDPDRPCVSSTDPVDVYHELGTASMPARPVLAPAAAQHADAIAADIQRRVGDAIRDSLRRP